MVIITVTYSKAQKDKALNALKKLLGNRDISPSGEMQELSRSVSRYSLMHGR